MIESDSMQAETLVASGPDQTLPASRAHPELIRAQESSPPATAGHLLVRYRQGDQGAFAGLMAVLGGSVYSYLARLGIREDEREDLFQEVFIKLHRQRDRYDQTRPIRPWLFAIVANTARSHYREHSNRQPRDTNPNLQNRDCEHSTSSNQLASPEKRLQARETAHWLEEQLESLPLPQREVVLMACIEQMPLQEVAEALQLPVNTVKTYLRRARKSLAEAMLRRRRLLEREVSS